MTRDESDTDPLPWWYSGGGQSPVAEESALSALAGTAQAMVSWARQAFIDPHASHDVPDEHPECVLCRAVGTFRDLLGSASSASSASSARSSDPKESAPQPPAQPSSPIAWIAVTGEEGRDDRGP